jgi:hypothetical protein
LWAAYARTRIKILYLWIIKYIGCDSFLYI